jgi:hypothetical protein
LSRNLKECAETGHTRVKFVHYLHSCDNFKVKGNQTMTLASIHEETITDLNLQREIVSQIRTGPKHCTFVIECPISVQQVEGKLEQKKRERL